MRVYLVRHADAVQGADDHARPLSGLGKRQMRAVAALIRPLGLTVAAIWHSGLVRAEQSARLLAPVVQSRDGVVERDGLAPLDKPRHVASVLDDHDEDLMIVGHEPHLGKLACKLLTGSAGDDLLKIRKGSILCLNRDNDGKWRLEWMATPELAGSI